MMIVPAFQIWAFVPLAVDVTRWLRLLGRGQLPLNLLHRRQAVLGASSPRIESRAC